MRSEQDNSLDGLRSKARKIPLAANERRIFADKFNLQPAMQHFGADLILADDELVQVTLPEVADHHRGGLASSAVNGAVIAGMLDCALGVAGVVQFPDQRSGTVELSIKLLRPVLGTTLEFYSAAIKVSKSLAFTEAELFSGGRVCAIASGIVATASDKDWAASP